jgi:methyl-accepting chemotaxis protein
VLVQVDNLINRQSGFFKSLLYFVLLLPIFLPIISLCGCGNRKSTLFQNKGTLPRSNVSVDVLQSQLDEFEEMFTSRTKAAAAEIDRLSGDPKIMKMTLLWRSRAIPALNNILEQPQPMVVLVDSWLLCIRLTNYIETGEAANILGNFQPIALATIKELEAQIQDIARNVLSEELFNQTSDGLRSLALANPVQSGFSKTLMYSTQIKKDQPGLFESVLSIPLSPVRALEGVDRTPEAIYDFSTTTRRLTDVVQELPESSRWQLLLLLYDLEETDMAKKFLSSLQKISDNSDRLAATTEKFSTTLEDSDQSQEQIRQTLQQVNETAARLRELFNAAQQTATVFSQTARDVNLALTSWTEAARATDEAIRQIKPQSDQISAEPAPKTDLKETAQAVREAANEIKLLSEELPARTEQIIAQMNSLTTRLTINIAILIALVFCLFVAYLLIRKKLRLSKG